MKLPNNILEKQLCSVCMKYLSVGPIKVYPNREVKCGRCSENGDNGTESQLYSMMVKNILFPCVNCFEGCNKYLTIRDMRVHEETCLESEYDCPICDQFKGSAYSLNRHCQMYHQNKTLAKQNLNFFINLKDGNQQDCFYCSVNMLPIFIHFKFEIDFAKITFDVSFVGNKYEGDIFYSLSLCSVDNEIQFKLASVPCSKTALVREVNPEIDVSKLSFSQGIALCRLEIHEKPLIENYIGDKLQVVDPLSNPVVLRCNFNCRGKFFDGSNKQYFPAVFYILGMSWKVFILKKSEVGQKTMLGVFIEMVKKEEQKTQSWETSADFTLLSKKTNKTLSFQKRIFQPGSDYGFSNFIEWDFLLNPDNGFVDHGSTIKFDVLLKNDLPQKDLKCTKCLMHCNK